MARKRTRARRRTNPLSLTLPRNQWINARVRVTGTGKVQAVVSEDVLGGVKRLLGGGGGRKKNPSGKRYRVVTEARPGTYLLGGVRRHVSSWFSTRKDAEDFKYTYTNQPNAGRSRIEVGHGRVDIGPRGRWVR